MNENIAQKIVFNIKTILLNIFQTLKNYFSFNSIEKKIRFDNKVNLDKPIFSVIIPIYNRTWELEEAIKSVLNQSFVNYEIILICDGSPEETLKVVEKYEKHKQIKSFKYSNNSGNACRGRNKGIEIAKGKYITFLDSDDVCLRDRLFKTYKCFLEEQASVVAGSVEFIVDGSRKIDGIKHGDIAKTTEFNFDLLQKVNLLYTCTVSVSKKCLEEYGYFRTEMKYREDHELWLRLSYNGCKIFNSKDVFSKYRIHSGNAELTFVEKDEYWYQLMKNIYTTNYNWEKLL